MTVHDIVRECLPYGFVVRWARRKETKTRGKLAVARAQALRPVSPELQRALPRLNMGCGKHRQPGWINVDVDGEPDLKLFLDEATVLPMEDRSLEVVFSEHFVEHIPFNVATNFFRESYRALRPGGLFRCSTPDLDWLLASAQSAEWTRLRNVYRQIGDFPPSADWELAQVINWAFRGHGHQFLWNRSIMDRELASAGFVDIQRVSFGTSRITDAAIETRRGEDFCSLIIEALKP